MQDGKGVILRKKSLIFKLIDGLIGMLFIRGIILILFFVGDTKKTFVGISEKASSKNEEEFKKRYML